jgi:transcriptional regulator with XRE-family HTH domain
MQSNIGRRLREIRQGRNLNLRDVSDLSGVSRSMLSKIETGRSSPTATTLGKISEGLGISISQLVGGVAPRDVIVMRNSEHPTFRVPKTGFERWSLSPISEVRSVDFALNILPAGRSSGYFPPHREGVEETLYVASGGLLLWHGETSYALSQGDSIHYRANVPHRFDNTSTSEEVRFFVVVNNNGSGDSSCFPPRG